jgi:DNA-binding SARP family transcriptional activator
MGLSLKVFGEFALLDGSGKAMTLPTRKTRALLAYLAVNADRPAPRSRLMALLWGDRGEQQARHSLNQALGTLRKLASNQGETLLDSDNDSVALRGDSVDVDLIRFQALRISDPAQACDFYKGPFLDGLSISETAFDEWLTATRAELQNLVCDTLERAADSAASDGNIESAIELAQQLTKLDPLREDAHRRLMQLLFDNGDRAGAMRQYQACMETLKKELNVGPDAATNALFDTVRADLPTLRPSPTTNDMSSGQNRSLIAILPFKNLSGEADLDVLADGLVEDTIAGLERFHVVSVISSTSSSRYRDERPNARVIGAELGAAYLLEGSVRKARNLVRITAQLIDAAIDQNLWAQRYDRPLENPFDLQDEVSTGIIAAIEPVLIDAESRKGREAEPSIFKSAKLKQAVWHLYRFTKDNNAKAIEILNDVIAENPNGAGRYEALAMGHFWDFIFGWSPAPLESANKALIAAKKAVELDPNDPYKLSALSGVCCLLGNCDQANVNVNRAIELQPASAVPHGTKAWLCGHCGYPEAAIKSLETVLSLKMESPLISEYFVGGALGHLALNNWEEAARLAEMATVRRPISLAGWVVQTVAHHSAGNETEAARRFLNLVELRPDMTEEWLTATLPIKSPELKEHIFTALRALGLPAR